MYLLISHAANTPYQMFTTVLFVPLYTSHFAVDGTLFLLPRQLMPMSPSWLFHLMGFG
jgi:hypothetical protein